jgi:8-oxo-dGTP pyrophosphatase MutT (NUDIX family)
MARSERSAGFIAYHRAPGAAGPAAAPADPAPGQLFPPGPPSGVTIEYLLLDYGRHWDFPKGHVHPGEDDLAAARRELAEETGLTDARVIPGFQHEIVYFFRDRRKGLIRKTVVFFLAQLSARDVVLSHEHVGFDFLPFSQAVKRVTYASAREVLRAAHARLMAATSSKAAD